MSTNLEIINDALRAINVISEVKDASAEQGKFALRKLNQMMEVWREDGLDNLGWFAQKKTTETCPIPEWAEMAVYSSLSVMCAPNYGATISIELAAIIDKSLSTLLRKSLSEKLSNTDMSHLPIGQGHFSTRYNIVTDS